MQNIDIVQYIRYGMILRNFAEHDLFDAIIFESFNNSKIDIPESLTIETLDTTNSSSINAQLIALSEHYKRVCIILDSLSLSNILPFINTQRTPSPSETNVEGLGEGWGEGKLTILNLSTGASGLLHTGIPEMHDVGIALEYTIPTFEPHDFISLFKLLNGHQAQDNTRSINYIRIPYREYPGNLFPDVEIDPYGGITDLTTFELSGEYATLLCHGGHITSCIQAHPVLKENNKACDMFLLHQYGLANDHEAIIKSLEKTKKLIVVLDQHDQSSYKAYLQSRLFENGITDLEMFKLIIPDIASITTNQSQVLYDQAGFGVEGIVEKIIG